MSVRDFLRHNYRHFNAATVVEAAEGWVRHLEEQNDPAPRVPRARWTGVDVSPYFQ